MLNINWSEIAAACGLVSLAIGLLLRWVKMSLQIDIHKLENQISSMDKALLQKLHRFEHRLMERMESRLVDNSVCEQHMQAVEHRLKQAGL